jgi:hypothetical protein
MQNLLIGSSFCVACAWVRVEVCKHAQKQQSVFVKARSAQSACKSRLHDAEFVNRLLFL